MILQHERCENCRRIFWQGEPGQKVCLDCSEGGKKGDTVIGLTAAQRRFALDYDVPDWKVWLVVKLAKRSAWAGTHACNGDLPPAADRSHILSKSDYAAYWDAARAGIDAQLFRLLEPHGFTALEHNGLYPSLMRGEQTVFIPQD